VRWSAALPAFAPARDHATLSLFHARPPANNRPRSLTTCWPLP